MQKIIDKIYATNTPIPAHLKGNVLEINNTSDKNYNLKVGNTLVSPVCSVDAVSALEKESNGRIGTLGIVASQSTRTRSGAITDIIPLTSIGDEDWRSYPLIPIADMSLSSSIKLSDEEWDTLRATYDDNDSECYPYQACYFSEDTTIQMLYMYMPNEAVDEEIIGLAPGFNIQISSDIIMGQLYYYSNISEGAWMAIFITQRNGDSASALIRHSDDEEEPSVQVGSSFKDTIKLFMQKVPNFGLQASALGPLPEQLAHKMVNLLIPSVTALTVPSLKGVYIRNANSWDTVVTSRNLLSMLPASIEQVNATNEIPELKWGTYYDIYLDNNTPNGLECLLPYKSDASAPDQLLMVRIALNTHLIEGNIRHDLKFPNAHVTHWINGKSPNNPADMTQNATRGVLNIIVCAFGVGYAYWTND